MKIREALRLKALGLSNTTIAESPTVKCARSTLVELFARCKQANIDYTSTVGLSDDELEQLLYPNKHLAKPPSKPFNAAFWHEEQVRRGIDKYALWEIYIAEEANGLSYGRFSHHLKRYAEETSPQLSYPKERKAGEIMETDWCGDKLAVLYDVSTQQSVETSVFVASIGFSGRIFAMATLDETQSNWIQCHTKALEFFQAVPLFVVPDNTRTAVTKTNRYEPSKNPVFTRWAQHYAVAIRPARVIKPKDKDRVEAGVNLVEQKIFPALKDQIFFDLATLNQAILKEVHKINKKSYQKRTGTRNEIYQTIDLPVMRALPSYPFNLVDIKWATISKSRYHVHYDQHEYSAPHQLAGERVLLSATDMTIELLYKEKRVAFHKRSYDIDRIYVTEMTHMPESHRIQREIEQRIDETYLLEAAEIGDSTHQVIQMLLARQRVPKEHHNSCLGILRLADKHSPELLETACQQAVELEVCTYLEVQALIQRLTKTIEIPERNRHSNIRGATYYK